MHPDRIPDGYAADSTRSAERRVYESLRDTLGKDFSVFGWVSWIRKDPAARARDGEADFVVAHPELGLLVLEVKGGGIAKDGVTGQWSSVDRHGVRHLLRRSPYEQAKQGKYEIREKLRDYRGWHDPSVVLGHGVVFPDLLRANEPLDSDGPLEITSFKQDMPVLGARVASMFDYWGSQARAADVLGTNGVEAVRHVLARSFVMPMPLGAAIAEDSRETIRLTEPQYWVLDNLARNRRMLVSGRAGTGKTLLAVEKARRLASADGCRTLLTCFNKLLADYLRGSAGNRGNLEVMSFHELCFSWVARAGIEVPDPERQDLTTEFYRRSLPALFVDALVSIRDRYDAIVVDEGQDFGADDRAALELALTDRAHSVLYVFQDEAQALYRDSSPWPETGMATYSLSDNIRNTKAIHATLGRLAIGVGTRAFGPTGSAPEFIPVSGARAQAKELSRIVHRLIRVDGVPTEAIAILTSTRRNVPDIAPDGHIGAFQITHDHDSRQNRVLVESVTRFKGLERDVVVLVKLDPVDYCDFETLLYVGASRARSHLVVIAEPETLTRFGAGTNASGESSNG